MLPLSWISSVRCWKAADIFTDQGKLRLFSNLSLWLWFTIRPKFDKSLPAIPSAASSPSSIQFDGFIFLLLLSCFLFTLFICLHLYVFSVRLPIPVPFLLHTVALAFGQRNKWLM